MTAFPPSEVPIVPHRAAPVGPLRHLLSAVVALLVVPPAYVALDYAISRGLGRGLVTFQDKLPPVEALGPFLVGLLLLFIAAAAGRVSGLGPLLAGLLWGGVPAVLSLALPVTLAKGVDHLPHLYTQFGFGITTYGALVFPVMTVLLLGAAVAGRWR